MAWCRIRPGKTELKSLEEFDNTIGEVSMDPNTLHEVLLNLMSNAVDACLFDENMDKNWQVRLVTTKVEGKPHKI